MLVRSRFAEEDEAAEFEIAGLFDDIGGAATENEFDSAAPVAPAAEEESKQDG